MLVQKLSNFAKFDLDTKLSRFHFFHLIEEMSVVETQITRPEGEENGGDQVETVLQFNPEMYQKIQNAWTQALTTAQPPFQGDLENPVYLKIVNGLRSF
jgi:hypothetical protein